MSKKSIFLSVTLGALAIGIVYVGKKTGFFENDDHLYKELESN